MAGALTIKQEAFCLAYLETGNASEAYRRAYPASLKWKDQAVHVNASKMLAGAEVSLRIEELRDAVTEKGVLSAAATLLEVTRLASFDVRKLYRPNGSLVPIKELDSATAAAIQGVKVLEKWEGEGKNRKFVGYTMEYKVADKNTAIEKLFRFHGLYDKDNRQNTDPLREFLDSLAGNVVRPVEDDPGDEG